MNSLLMIADSAYSKDLEQFALDPELLDLISGAGVKCKYCAEVTTITEGPVTTTSVDCVSC